MAKPPHLRLSKRVVDRLPVDGGDIVFWDRELPGFGVRVYPSGRKVYVVQTRHNGRSQRVAMGRHGDIPSDRVRNEATKIIARLKAGLPPVEAKPGGPPTLADLAGRFQREHVAPHCKPGTARNYGYILRKHIVPRLGELPVAEVERKDIFKLQFELSGVPTVANRCLDILAKMLNLAELWEMRPPNRNPCRGVRRLKASPRRERFLTPEELGRLGQALEAAPAEKLASRHVAAAIRLLALTGCRKNEILGLAWDDLDFAAGEMWLRDSKTGERMVPMPPAAAEVLASLPRTGGNPWVFPGRKKGSRQVNIHVSWDRVRKRAGLDDVRLHDLRHTFASRALAIGEGLPMIGELLGHRRVGTTARYAHLARESIQAATAKVADSIGAEILD
ncbi:MAG: site-specific integrase [Gammaproteobacteria bacterium]|nr:site-specific integrase [Gammaproteobacteria bacterium]MCY4182404.1 site-specific integrase [Gammaproteobacteria bacterium]MCY4269535.1 site-specific integrase [Gammaproteobacteria bacterium]MCY4297561.1 site-specific integrase [Gammaproteobacteria bacterium]